MERSRRQPAQCNPGSAKLPERPFPDFAAPPLRRSARAAQRNPGYEFAEQQQLPTINETMS